MAKEHIVPITYGVGSKELVNGEYSVTSNTLGYDNSSITPKSVTIENNVTTYNFTIEGKATLTIHVSDDGTPEGIPIVGASFKRADYRGEVYDKIITTDDSGNAIFEHLPYSETSPVKVYFKQLNSDGEHTFSSLLEEISMDSLTKTIELSNPDATLRTFNLTDANYINLPIENGNIILNE